MTKQPVLTDAARPLSIQQQKKQAKELRNALRTGSRAALVRFRRHHPKADGLKPEAIGERLGALADAQLVIARELGLPSWPKLIHHIERMDAARRAIADRAPAPDGARKTLHVRCGSDIQTALQDAGFAGDFQEYSDPLCQGPVIDGPEYFERRADFIAKHYDLPDRDRAQVHTNLIEQHDRLKAAAAYTEIVLWFEHDPYDQLLLARVLDILDTHAPETRTSIVSLDRFPSIDRFIGLGNLSPTALRRIFEDRQPVTRAMYTAGRSIWKALCAPSPMPLHKIATAAELPGLPYMAAALLRHLAELPGLVDGLSLTERLTLDILRGGQLSGNQLFRKLLLEREPLSFLGDTMFWYMLAGLCDAKEPAIEIIAGDRSAPAQAIYRMTERGVALLAGQSNFSDCGPLERWVGGVQCFSGPNWRWDTARQIPVAAIGQL